MQRKRRLESEEKSNWETRSKESINRILKLQDQGKYMNKGVVNG